MTFLNLCSNSLILSVAFTLLISGVIVFLMNTKISRLEKNIQKQNQALADMINHIKADVNMIMMTLIPIRVPMPRPRVPNMSAKAPKYLFRKTL